MPELSSYVHIQIYSMSLIFERLNTIHAEYELPTWNDGVDLTEGLL